MNSHQKTPLPENTKNDSSDIERVKADRAKLANEGKAPQHNLESAPPEPDETKEAEEAEKGHS